MTFALAAEAGPVQRRDSRLAEKTIGDLSARAESEPGDVREDIERAVRETAGDPWDRVQSVGHRVPAATELREHRVDLGRARGERRRAGALHERRGPRD